MSVSVKLRKVLCFLLSVVLISSVVLASEKQNGADTKMIFYTYADASNPNTRINVSQILGEDTFVLPSNVSADAVTLFCDTAHTLLVEGELGETEFVSGQTLDLTTLCKENQYRLLFKDGILEYKLKFLFTDSIPSVFLLRM